MEWERLPVAALVSGAILFTVGLGFHLVIPLVWPQLSTEYQNQALFRSWDGWTRAYMAAHPWVYGVLFAGVFLAIRGGGMRDGLGYGLAVFLVGSLPVFALNFASFQVRVGVIACWTLQNLCQCCLAGLTLGWYCPRSIA
jgi:hypothetical protein